VTDRRTDRTFLLEEQYRTADNLRARIDCHKLFSTSPVGWPEWVFSGYDFGADADVLEVGCGDGSMWAEKRDWVPEGWRLTLTDMSPGMVEAARAAVGDRAEYAVADVQELPFPDGSFDAAIANHVLFHVPDRARALRELARVLRPGGVLVGTMIGQDHFRELRDLLGGEENVIWSESRKRFGLETARVQLERVFADVEIEPFADSLAVTEVKPFLRFVRSLDTPGLTETHLRRIRGEVARAIEERGSFHVTKSSGRFHCRKP
jgi:ubiquinone/menaquinone biosynthesis C-methylase UbiE